MSYFGDDTFKQDLLDEIEILIREYSLSRHQAVSEIAQVLSYLSETVFSRDEEMNKIRKQSYEDARNDLIRSPDLAESK